MANIAGVNIPVNKPVAYALRYVFGIGLTRAKDILRAVNIEETRRVNTLNEEELAKIRSFIDKNYKIEGDLKHEISSNKRNKIAIRSYQGIRHQLNLPVRGQNTHGNSNTRRRGRA